MPNGTVIREELEKLAKEQEFLDGYERVSTSHHPRKPLPYFGTPALLREIMFPPMSRWGKMFLKPMNCPHHHLIYRSQPRSYRELPRDLPNMGPAIVMNSPENWRVCCGSGTDNERRPHLLHCRTGERIHPCDAAPSAVF